MILALITETIILIGSFFSCLACCLPSLFAPLPFLAILASTLLAIAIAIFGAKNQDFFYYTHPYSTTSINNNSYYNQTIFELGYSFYIAIGACGGLFKIYV